jgi:integrase
LAASFRVNGKRHAKTVRGTVTEAKRELRRLLKSADDGNHIAPNRMTLAQWAEQWLALLQRPDGTRRLISRRSWERYDELLRLHVLPKLGARSVQQITPTEIDELYVELERKLAPRTVQYVHVTVNACLGAAARKGVIATNPAERADAPRGVSGNVGHVLDEEQLAALLGGLQGSALYPIVAVAAFTGARRGEILALRWSDFDAESKTLRIERAIEDTRSLGRNVKEPKTTRGIRTITIDPALVDLLTTLRDKHLRYVAGVGDDDETVDLSLARLPEGALIFPSPVEPFSLTRLRAPKTVTKQFPERAQRLGFTKLRFHDLRGTHETLLLDAGVPVHVVAARCGHDPAMLLRSYAKRTRKADTSAAAVIGAISKMILAT